MSETKGKRPNQGQYQKDIRGWHKTRRGGGGTRLALEIVSKLNNYESNLVNWKGQCLSICPCQTSRQMCRPHRLFSGPSRLICESSLQSRINTGTSPFRNWQQLCLCPSLLPFNEETRKDERPSRNNSLKTRLESLWLINSQLNWSLPAGCWCVGGEGFRVDIPDRRNASRQWRWHRIVTVHDRVTIRVLHRFHRHDDGGFAGNPSTFGGWSLARSYSRVRLHVGD